MPDSPTSELTAEARRAFFDDGVDPRGLVPDGIRDSWLRCRRLGLEAGHRPGAGPAAHPTLREAQERYETLRRICRPELEALHAAADRAHSIVILTAPDGFILDALGNPAFLDKAARVALRPGAPWGESVTGTNAIGTALVERRPLEVKGAEHYYRAHQILSCSATPLFGPRGEVLGALDLSSEASVHHTFALYMVQHAAEQIEERLFEREFEAADILRIGVDPEALETTRAGLLVVRGQRVEAANRRALQLLGIDRKHLGADSRWDALFRTALPPPSQIGEATSVNGGHFHVQRGISARPRIAYRVAARPAPKPGHAPQAMFTATVDARIDRAARLLDADIPILLQGETGVGKEITAREIYRRSTRSSATFVPINCAALPAALIESELFGYQPGAFTGARREGAKGLLREADGGTLFLDEIGDMPVELQTRLLRVLQEREVTPVGGGRSFPVDFRVISATHQDVADLAATGRFRADLYYRIAQSVIHLPALRDYEDRPTAVARLWDTLGGPQSGLHLAPELVARLTALPWPGNLRQLAGVLRSLMALGQAGATLTCADLPPELQTTTAPDPVPSPSRSGDLRTIEQQAIDAATRDCHGNVAAAARQLGISRSTIYRRLAEQAAQR
ncbi:MAG: sigma-54-dependent Fis family transcriptional regulator [Nevskiaceae bacterium]|nr:MAG: sigma-54-dependent Fis family transcriptional regulator [Nevskiaceae bacterium]TBR74791.1 MAG: sigma-54-dependent Fis family transcriptional regulator [Nevskiaceae bacterium]